MALVHDAVLVLEGDQFRFRGSRPEIRLIPYPASKRCNDREGVMAIGPSARVAITARHARVARSDRQPTPWHWAVEFVRLQDFGCAAGPAAVQGDGTPAPVSRAVTIRWT